MDNNQVIVSRDVHFYENIFPYSVSVLQDQLPSCPLPVIHPSIDLRALTQDDPHNIPSSSESSLSTSENIPVLTPSLRRSARISHPPTWLNDFVYSANHPSSLHSHTPAYMSFVASLSVLQEPTSSFEAVKHKEWRETMNTELQTLEANNTWKLSSLPAGKRAIGCKWVFKTKLRADGTVERDKALLSFTVRIFLAIVAARAWPIQQLDINNEFLHASRQWNAEFTLKFTSYGFIQSVHDHCLFVKPSSSGLMALLVYVDDILIIRPSIADITQVKYLHQLIHYQDLGDARYFLGLEIARSASGLYIAQTKYILDIVNDTGLLQAKSASTPFPSSLKLAAGSDSLFSHPDLYRRFVGRLLYLGFSRSDISYPVQQLSQYLNQPCDSHWKAALHVVRYLKGYPSKGLYFPAANPFTLRAFCDADWASCLDSRRSLIGYCIFFGDALVSWKTKKQSTVSRSTAESEYRSLASTAVLHIMENPFFHERTKHIELDCHLVKDAYKDGFVSPSFVPDFLQLADAFTNYLRLMMKKALDF
ncbi:UNVERIFIED_CONTAM: Retrovirus-related Pol polyprotein from transposon RE2 [Sesamum indicum]